MLFNSYEFIFVFLPVALAGYQVACLFRRWVATAWLGCISLVFYAYWQPKFLAVLLFSIVVNYLATLLIGRRIASGVSSHVWLVVAIAANLGALCYFKYLFPLLNAIGEASGSQQHWSDVVLPLGISFFTFTQIAFLVDLYQGIAEPCDLSDYILFVTFFPHLIAGPILHHKEMMPQFQKTPQNRLNYFDMAMGLSWFIMGLGKKVLLADNLAPTANAAFDAVHPSTSVAWLGALAYSLQLYFDFSGYSDMALGSARMFSINFPLNFDSPFKSASIIEFWQRWHLTLSRYITAYLYTPIQRWVVSRRQLVGKGSTRKDTAKPAAFLSIIGFPMILTMFIAGVWHGAGLQYMVFGLLHGFYLTVNHAWRLLARRLSKQSRPTELILTIRRVSSTLLTFLCVLISFVFFRAHGTGNAVNMLLAMAGGSGDPVPGSLLLKAVTVADGFAIVWLLPNTQEILKSLHSVFAGDHPEP